ncbi:MAG: peptide deformylase [Limosilactobacillus gorillae]|jgi:peptide deformylase|uniref:peptide deformylase n=1 Tax=Limosilactobacillus gorillae TaxID=1450649 RepID=UPI000ABDDC68|nr:peptide deformylase [Limosilactobacillus gorillae]MDO4855471.1 peptide deformylase [Limosilactobacillus gorillae]
MIYPITHDQTLLQKPARKATIADTQLAANLVDTLSAHQDHCIGIAANMIGFPVAIIAVSLGPINLAMLNPRLIKKVRPYQTEEGCLSLTGIRPTTRYKEIQVTYLDTSGQPNQLTLTGLAAQAVQHELDHLKGILI